MELSQRELELQAMRLRKIARGQAGMKQAAATKTVDRPKPAAAKKVAKKKAAKNRRKRG